MSKVDRVLLLLAALLITLAFMREIALDRNRLDDLEERVTTFETVRIEYVAPPEGGQR